MYSSAVLYCSCLSIPWISSPNVTFLRTFLHGNSEYSWNTIPLSREGPLSSLPSKSISPLLGSSKPAISLSNVLFPQPEGPITHKNSEGLIAKLMHSNAVSSPSSVLNVFVTFRSSSLWFIYFCITIPFFHFNSRSSTKYLNTRSKTKATKPRIII